MEMWDSVKEEEEEEELVFVKTEEEDGIWERGFEFAEGSKRKRVRRTEMKEEKKKKKKKCTRWSAERYRNGEQSLLEIMKKEGASFERPMSRAALRVAARKSVGDTGLLDHLLKHTEGKAVGAHRFRRWHNPAGVLEYWLEDAHLAPLRSRLNKPHYWIPSSVPQMMEQEEEEEESEVQVLREQVKQLSAVVQSQQQQQCQVAQMFKDVMKWKAETDQHLKLVLSSWKTMQDMYEQVMGWKAKVREPWEEWLDHEQQQQRDLTAPPSLHNSPSLSQQLFDWKPEMTAEGAETPF